MLETHYSTLYNRILLIVNVSYKLIYRFTTENPKTFYIASVEHTGHEIISFIIYLILLLNVIAILLLYYEIGMLWTVLFNLISSFWFSFIFLCFVFLFMSNFCFFFMEFLCSRTIALISKLFLSHNKKKNISIDMLLMSRINSVFFSFLVIIKWWIHVEFELSFSIVIIGLWFLLLTTWYNYEIRKKKTKSE